MKKNTELPVPFIDAMKKIGELVKASRLQSNLSQKSAAEVTGMSVPTFCKIERGVPSISIRHYVDCLTAFKLPATLVVGALVRASSHDVGGQNP